MYSHRARAGDSFSRRARARDRAILHPCDGQAWCARAQPQLGRRFGLSSRVLGFGGSSEAASRLGEWFTEILSARCFRIDLRLRPGGRSAPLVTPIDGAINYYENLGEPWERAALLRARPVAGDLEIGHQLRTELNHFVFRSYLDFDTLRHLRAMKHQIEAELRTPAMIERNIKLGRGGIRELEFIVQALTLIYGGRDPRLRIEQTVAALEKLDALGYLPSEARARTCRRVPVPARRRAQAASRRRPANPRAPPTPRAGCARWRREWASAKPASDGRIQRAAQISSRDGRDAIPRDACRR